MDTNTRKRAAAGIEALTPKEREVLELIAQGQTNAEIAESLHITFPTAKSHVSAILSKLGVESREDAATVARSHRPSRWHSKLHALGFGSLALKLAGAGALVLCAAVGAVAFAATRDSTSNDTLVVKLSDLQAGQPRLYKPAILGSTPWGDPYGVWVVLQSDGTVDAFFDRDPWSYCITQWYPDAAVGGYIGNADGVRPAVDPPNLVLGSFEANCSGWQFDVHGVRWFGATPRGLDSFPVHIEGEAAVIRFDQVQLGLCVPGSAVPPDCSQLGAPQVRATVPPPIMPTYGFPNP